MQYFLKVYKMIVSILESVYLVFMFLFFETSVDFNVLASPRGYLFKHLIGNTVGNRICPFGQIAIFGLIAVLLFRPKGFVRCALVIAFVLSLMNLNALVYLIPIFIIEQRI